MDAERESKRIQDVVGQSNSCHDRWNVQSFIIPGGCPEDDGLIALTREALIDVP